MLKSVFPMRDAEEITCLSRSDPAFEDVVRLRHLALPRTLRAVEVQDAFDDVANIYLLRHGGEAVLTLRTIHANATNPCEMEGLYPAAIIGKYRHLVMHTSRLARHPGMPANSQRLVRFMSHVLMTEFAKGIRVTFATSPMKHLAGYRRLGFAVVQETSFSFLDTGDESRLIVQPADARWRSPFTAALRPSGSDLLMEEVFQDILCQVEGDPRREAGSDE